MGILKKIKESVITGACNGTKEYDEFIKRMIFDSKIKLKGNIIKYSVLTLDLVFSIVLGVIALIIIFCKH